MTDTAEMIQAETTTAKRGNPLMKPVEDVDILNNSDFVFSKLDSVFKKVEDETLLNAALWKNYLAWRKEAPKRNKLKAAQRLKDQMVQMGLTDEDIRGVLG